MQNQCRSVEAGLFLDMYLESPATKLLFGIHISWFADRCDFFCQRGHLSARRLKSAPISRYGNYLLSPQHLISAIVSLMDLAYSGQMHLTTYLGIQLDLGHLRYKPRGTGIRSRHSVPVRSKDIMSASPK